MKTPDSAFYLLHCALKWLPDMDLNHDKQIQSLLCYRYTIGQTGGFKVGIGAKESRQQRMKTQNPTTHTQQPEKSQISKREGQNYLISRGWSFPPGFNGVKSALKAVSTVSTVS